MINICKVITRSHIRIAHHRSNRTSICIIMDSIADSITHTHTRTHTTNMCAIMFAIYYTVAVEAQRDRL